VGFVSVRFKAAPWGWLFLVWWSFTALFVYGSYQVFGADEFHRSLYGNPALIEPFGQADPLSVWARWDSKWYLQIANFGYEDPSTPNFFPLYPLLSRLLGEVIGLVLSTPEAILVAAIGISLVCFAVALRTLYRLCRAELGGDVAMLTAALVAFFPMAFFYGSAYTESLFLALSVGAIWFARSDRWAWAGICGALAAATRNPGWTLVVPLALIYLLGPRGMGAQARPYLGLPWRDRARGPRSYPVRRDALWILLVPLGLAAYMLFLGLSEGNPLLFAETQRERWQHQLGEIAGVPAGPLGGLVDATEAAGRGLRSITEQPSQAAIWAPDDGRSLRAAGINIESFAFLIFAIVGVVGALRRLPLAYGAYSALSLILVLSLPVSGGLNELGALVIDAPFKALPRYMAVSFPLFMWLALWTRERGLHRLAVIASALLLGLYSAQWGTWQWVS
jgi:hypothetical protein